MGVAFLWKRTSAVFGHADLDIEAAERAGLAVPGSPQREGLRVIPCNRDADEMTVADNAVGRVEIDPAGAGKINLQPCVRGAATARGVMMGQKDVAATKPGAGA